jgi:hypothetical protein
MRKLFNFLVLVFFTHDTLGTRYSHILTLSQMFVILTFYVNFDHSSY